MNWVFVIEANTRFREVMSKLHINPDYLIAMKQSWAEQFRLAANVNEGDLENASAFNYFMHVIGFPWKILFALVPPPSIWGGWLCFTVSIVVIGGMTALVGDAAAIFGCLVNLKDSVTAIRYRIVKLYAITLYPFNLGLFFFKVLSLWAPVYQTPSLVRYQQRTKRRPIMQLAMLQGPIA
jgi:hypothetical protein